MILNPSKAIQPGPREFFLLKTLTQDTYGSQWQTTAQAFHNSTNTFHEKIMISMQIRKKTNSKAMVPDIVSELGFASG